MTLQRRMCKICGAYYIYDSSLGWICPNKFDNYHARQLAKQNEFYRKLADAKAKRVKS